ncbi:hypothetical protein RB195_020993 [Necator americanus]
MFVVERRADSNVDHMSAICDLELENDRINPIIGEDVFLTEPFKCTERCICRKTPFHQNNNQITPITSASQQSQLSIKSEPSWPWGGYFDRSFTAPDFPHISSHSASWDEVFSRPLVALDGHNFIKEIFVNDRHLVKPDAIQNSEPPKFVEPRQKFQRFRQKKFVCDECDRSFTMKQNVQQHFFQYHNPNGARKKAVRTISKRFQCTKCNKIFKTLEKAKRHEVRMHGEKISPSVFVCHHCNKVYNAHSQLKEHVDVVHENRRPYKCEHCGVNFGRAGGLRRHDMMVHQQRTHACPYKECKHPGYKCTKALAAHIRSVHTMDRPFKCLFCEKTFVRKNDLKVHETTHSTQCEYMCAKCNSSFRRSIYLQKHEKRCNGEGRRKSARLESQKLNSLTNIEETSIDDSETSVKVALQLTKDVISDEKNMKVAKRKDDSFGMESVCAQTEDDFETAERRRVERPLEILEEGELPKSLSLESTNTVHYNGLLCDSNSGLKQKSSSPNKRHRKTLLKLPRKSVTRCDKEKPDVREGKRINSMRSCSEIDDDKKRIESEGNAFKIEPLEEGEIPPTSAKKEIFARKQDDSIEGILRKRIRYEPREEAVVPKKRPRPVFNLSILSRKYPSEFVKKDKIENKRYAR